MNRLNTNHCLGIDDVLSKDRSGGQFLSCDWCLDIILLIDIIDIRSHMRKTFGAIIMSRICSSIVRTCLSTWLRCASPFRTRRRSLELLWGHSRRIVDLGAVYGLKNLLWLLSK